ncbi:MAG: S-ribosylhomocysteine lyase [Clostridiales bacterium]|jgi:S-ribosylhomocysteine lyase|nr:S-ribosylhomocysteine lyase [Clostridiales bacterium]
MKRIASFLVDHETLEKGFYLSRVDGDVFTYDLRMKKPYADPLLTNAELHSLEHILATVLRNGARAADVLYVGPMGCQTGFYVLLKGVAYDAARALVKSALEAAADWDAPMPGGSKRECGNCLNLSVAAARETARAYLTVLSEK